MLPTLNDPHGPKCGKRTFPTRLERDKLDAGDPNAFDKPEDPKQIGPWILGRTIGKGASGRVKIAQHENTNQFAAVKIIPFYLSSMSNDLMKAERHRANVEREIALMKLMDHPNVIRLYDVWEGNGNLYLILEWVDGGELFDRLVERGSFKPAEALAYFRQVIYGLSYCHTLSIAHRDLKLENLLLYGPNENKLLKIADWGMAVFQSPYNGLQTACGSPHYVSPEVITGHPYDGVMADVWSGGIVLYTLLCGRPPFEDKCIKNLLEKIASGKYTIPKDVHPAAADLIRRMLIVNVYARITIPEILGHPFLMYDSPGIIYNPPPCLFTLQVPILSAMDLDEDILADLNVIFGRHVPVEDIIDQLLWQLPNYAKAFYVLLLKFRERQFKSLQGTWDKRKTDAGLHPYRICQSKLQVPIGPPLEYSDWERAGRMRRPVVYDVSDRYPALLQPRLNIPGLPQSADTHRDPPMQKRPAPRRRDTAPGPFPHFTQVSHAPFGKHSTPANPKPKRHEMTSRLKIPSPIPLSDCISEVPSQSSRIPVVIPENHVDDALPSQPLSAPPHIQHFPPDYLVPIGGYSRDLDLPPEKAIVGHRTVKEFVLKDYTRQMEVLPEQFELDRVNDHKPQQGKPGDSSALGHTTKCDRAIPHSPEPLSPLVDNGNVLVARPPMTGEERGKCKPTLPLNNPRDAAGHDFNAVKEKENQAGKLQTAKRGKRMVRKNRPADLDLHKASQFLSRGASANSPGQSTPLQEFREWINNLNSLFHSKTPPYAFFSCRDCIVSRKEVIALLSGTPVSYIQDSGGLLKCKQEDKYDHSGTPIQKFVRFRIEFVSSRVHMPTAAYLPEKPDGCTITFIHERGSISTFRKICDGIKSQWRLEPLYSANLNGVYTTDQSPLAVETVSGFLMIRGNNEITYNGRIS